MSFCDPSFFVPPQENEVDALFKDLLIISLVSPFTLKGNKFLGTMWKKISNFKSVVIGDDHEGCQKLRGSSYKSVCKTVLYLFW